MIAAIALTREFDFCAAIAEFGGDEPAAVINGRFVIGRRLGADESGESFEHGSFAGMRLAQDARH